MPKTKISAKVDNDGKRAQSGGGGAFEYPFEPYPSQLEFSEALYGIINGSKIGILESPTGTVNFPNLDYKQAK